MLLGVIGCFVVLFRLAFGLAKGESFYVLSTFRFCILAP